ELEFDPVRGINPDTIHVDGDVYAIAYSGPDYDGFLKTVSISSDGSIGAVIDTLEFDPVLCHETDIIHVAGDVYAIAYRGPDQHGFLKTVSISSAGSIGAVIATLEFDPFSCTNPHIIHVAGDGYAIAYQGLGSDGWLNTVSISDDGSIGAVIATLEFDPVYASGPHIIHMSGDVYAIAYSGPDSDGWLKTIEIIIPPTVTTDPATDLGAVAATLNGTLDNDAGEACDCGFEWGLDTGYGTITSTESRTTGR
ncbi:unnamed protein product, partial [marine sediment metagenome]